jgi:uncharacterized protein
MSPLQPHSQAVLSGQNSPASIRERASAGHIPLAGPLLLVTTRTCLLVASQALVALLLLERHHSAPWREAADWWAVYGTVADLGCLALLRYFICREGIGFRDLIGTVRFRHAHDLWLGLGYYLLVFPVFLASGWLARKWLFASASDLNRYLVHAHAAPLWAVLYGLSIWWILWSPTEEATYQAYCLPRLEVLTGRTWAAMLIVGFWWTAQHCALPFIPDWRYLAYRFVAFSPGVICLMLLYLRTRRLMPLIFAHWPMDIAAAIIHALY